MKTKKPNREHIYLRAMKTDDLRHVMKMQCLTYGEHLQEELPTFQRKLRTYPKGCWVASFTSIETSGRGGIQRKEVETIAGYLFSHPWNASLPPPCLNAKELDMFNQEEEGVLISTKRKRDLSNMKFYYYIHDVSVDPSFAGLGIGKMLVLKALECSMKEQRVRRDIETFDMNDVVPFDYYRRYQHKMHQHQKKQPTYHHTIENKQLDRFVVPIVLVSVQSSFKFWEKFGFREWTRKKDYLGQVKESYGDDAYLMKAILRVPSDLSNMEELKIQDRKKSITANVMNEEHLQSFAQILTSKL